MAQEPQRTTEEATLTEEELQLIEASKLREAIEEALRIGDLQLIAGMEEQDIAASVAFTAKGVVREAEIQIFNCLTGADDAGRGFTDDETLELRRLFLRLYVFLTVNASTGRLLRDKRKKKDA